MSTHRLAYVVPTKDRRADLEKLLVSLSRQTVVPQQIVVVDASDPPVRDLCERFPDLPLTYVREFPPSLARQRNAGMAALRPEITVAGYLDDDLELEPDATERMQAFWDAADASVGGAAFSILNQPTRDASLGRLSDFFLLNGREQGRVLPSGFATSIGTVSETLQTEWLYGGATLWRRDVVERFSFDEWYIGHGYLEDLDYSFRVSRTHQLWVVADAKVWHWPHPVKVALNTKLGRQQVVNRVYFVRKAGGFSRAALAWALFGQCFRNAAESLHRRDRGGLLRFWGNLRGLVELATHGTRQVEGIWK